MFYRERSLEVMTFNFITGNQGKLTLLSVKHINLKSTHIVSSFGFRKLYVSVLYKNRVEMLSEAGPCCVISGGLAFCLLIPGDHSQNSGLPHPEV